MRLRRPLNISVQGDFVSLVSSPLRGSFLWTPPAAFAAGMVEKEYNVKIQKTNNLSLSLLRERNRPGKKTFLEVLKEEMDKQKGLEKRQTEKSQEVVLC